jgi:predicted nucleic acid-binding protein
MDRVFVDTATWLALINKRDGLHRQSQEKMAVLARQKAHLVRTEFVLIEVANALSAPHLRAITLAFVASAR